MTDKNSCSCKKDKTEHLVINITKCIRKHATKSLKNNSESNGVEKPQIVLKDGSKKNLSEVNIKGLPISKNVDKNDLKQKSDKHSDNFAQASILDRLDIDCKDKVIRPIEKIYKDPQSSTKCQMKLPVLIPRYHGEGCALEIDVLEKHHNKCRYRKKTNDERFANEDTVGSYETIGRLAFRTCNKSLPEFPAGKTTNSSKISLFPLLDSLQADIFSNENHIEIRKSQSDIFPLMNNYLIKNHNILDKLLKSSKLFPLNKSDIYFPCDACVKCSCLDCNCYVNNENVLSSYNADKFTQTIKMKLCGKKFILKWISGVYKKLKGIKMLFNNDK